MNGNEDCENSFSKNSHSVIVSFMDTRQPILCFSLLFFTTATKKYPHFSYSETEQTRNVLLLSVYTVQWIRSVCCSCSIRQERLLSLNTWWHFSRIFSRRLNRLRNRPWHAMTYIQHTSQTWNEAWHRKTPA